MFIPSKNASLADTKFIPGSTLILPAVSIGNVPQLAVDLLVNTLRIPRIGAIDSASLTPISGQAGYDHLNSNTRSLPLEVYQTTDGKWTILQQRAPPLPKHHRVFAREMLDFIRQNEIARVVVLASSDAALRTDSLIDGSQIRSLAVNWSVDDGLVDRLQAMSLDDFAIGSGRSDVLKTKLKQLHSAGVTRPLLELCEQEGIPTLALVSLVSEGDNVPDGIALASATNASLGLATLAEIAQWRPPRGWEWLMSGNIAPRELY